jgi:predicted secreted protein
MGIVSGLALFFIIWWTVLFAVLPWGVTRNDGTVRGADAGAPQNPRLRLKFAITTGISIIIWLVVYVLVTSEVISFRDLAERMAM